MDYPEVSDKTIRRTDKGGQAAKGAEKVGESRMGNISKQKREDLIAKIKEIRRFIAGAEQDENTGNLLTYLSELEKDVKGKKYGLVFEEHRESVDDLLDTHVPVLTEERELFIDNGGKMNFLIEGDNLAALKLLMKTHRNTIKMIYIDPPYNTTNKDFMYDDKRIGPLDGYRHSMWISFMQKRLSLAKHLLSNDGCIFISIDDNEFANLKLLCDSIFGETNFVCSFVWQKRYSAPPDTKEVGYLHETILMYRKSQNFKMGLLIFTSAQLARYKNPDNDPRGDWKTTDYTCRYTATERPSLYYPIINPNTQEEIWPKKTRVWAFSKESHERNVTENRIWWGVNGKNHVPTYKNFVSSIKQGLMPSTLLFYEDVGHTDEATKELRKLLPNVKFTPKPIRLMCQLQQIANVGENDIILDFFAGSGTTGHSVMRLNANNNAKRSFILCTNNENNICREITYERLKRAMKTEDYTDSLKFYKVDFVPVTERLYYEYADELLLHIRELVELENGISFLDNAEIAIVLTDDELFDFVSNINSFKKCRKLYIGHNVLPTGQQQDALKKAHVEVNVIPNYYYNELEG